jgi:uncharacterized membrane protein YhaH (DUF805 family)
MVSLVVNATMLLPTNNKLLLMLVAMIILLITLIPTPAVLVQRAKIVPVDCNVLMVCPVALVGLV